MSWTTNDIPDLPDASPSSPARTAGLGLESARALTAAGAHVVMAVRNQAKAASAVEDIMASVPDASLEAGRPGPSFRWSPCTRPERPLPGATGRSTS